MKFYLLKRGTDSVKFCEPIIFDESDWKKEFLFRCEYKQIHELPIPYSVVNKYEPSDFPISDSILVSGNFFKIIKELNNIYKGFESQLYYKKTEKIGDMYYTIILPDFELFNWEKSEYKEMYNTKTNKKIVTNLKKIVIDKNKIDKISKNNFFILSEKRTEFICTETAKKAIEEAGLTGVNFEELEVM